MHLALFFTFLGLLSLQFSGYLLLFTISRLKLFRLGWHHVSTQCRQSLIMTNIKCIFSDNALGRKWFPCTYSYQLTYAICLNEYLIVGFTAAVIIEKVTATILRFSQITLNRVNQIAQILTIHELISITRDFRCRGWRPTQWFL